MSMTRYMFMVNSRIKKVKQKSFLKMDRLFCLQY